eukprot:UN05110
MYQNNIPLDDIAKFAKLQKSQINNIVHSARDGLPFDPAPRNLWSYDGERLKVVEAALQHYDYDPTFDDIRNTLDDWGFGNWSDAIIRKATKQLGFTPKRASGLCKPFDPDICKNRMDNCKELKVLLGDENTLPIFYDEMPLQQSQLKNHMHYPSQVSLAYCDVRFVSE